VRLLIDTHILLWWLNEDPLMPARADALLFDPSNQVFVSAICIWEISIKTAIGKLEADVQELLATIPKSGFLPLPFTLEHAAAVHGLPDLHKDPFDRALVAQARLEPMHLVTHDDLIAAYGGTVILV
jgi:PIN domain nuclease of toxin-antitoxin system